MPAIEFNNINKTYPGEDGTVALENINLKVEDGEFVCLLGPSGCGKSTLLEIAAGLLPRTTGEVLLDGEVQKSTSRDIGVVFQDSALYHWRTVRKNIEFGMELAKIPKKERLEKSQKYIEMVGLNGFEDKYPHQLSGGMRQRVGLARTLVNDPKIILMDEPFSAVDHLTRVSLQDEMIRIWQKEKKTIIFVTHDVSEAVYLATKVVLLSTRPGRIQKIFNIPVERPRNRNDISILDIVEKIYVAINDASAPSKEVEYFL